MNWHGFSQMLLFWAIWFTIMTWWYYSQGLR